MKKVVVFGSTGNTGLCVVEAAVSKGKNIIVNYYMYRRQLISLLDAYCVRAFYSYNEYSYIFKMQLFK